MNDAVYDYIIIGQGLAGTLVAYELKKHTSNFLIVDAEKETASFAAAGIINPVTGRNFVKSWLMEELLPVAITSYREMEKELATSLVKELNIVRSLSSVKEENDWNARLADPGYIPYMQAVFESKELNHKFNEKVRYGMVTQSLQINLPLLIKAYRAKWKEEGRYVNATIDSSDIQTEDSHYLLSGFKAKTIIFCEGYKAIENPYVKSLGFVPSKGHAIWYKCDLELDVNYKDDFFITPLENRLFWSGWGNQNKFDFFGPDEKEVSSKMEAIQQKIGFPIDIESIMTGIRPATKRRRPVVGRVNGLKNGFIFNGLGTKGTSLGPFFAQKLVDLIIHQKEIPSELKVSFEDAL